MLLADEVLSCLTIVKFMSTSLGFWCKGWPLKVQMWIPPPKKKKKTYSLPHCIWQAWRVFSFDQHRSFYKISKILDFSKKGSYVRAELLVTWRRCFNSLNFRQCYCALAIKMYALFWSERIFYQNCPFYDRFRC